MAASTLPTCELELTTLADGYSRIAGIDEVGRGCVAGPVVAAAVIFPEEVLRDPRPLEGVRDSKIVPEAERDVLRDLIYRHALAVGVGVMPTELIDAIGIAPAARLAMMAAVDDLAIAPDHLLIDFVKLNNLEIPQTSIVDGDALCLSIAAASLVAKTTRDQMMRDAEAVFPGYAFGEHKGYATAAHLAALAELGPTPLHRRSFAPLRLQAER
ncbi:MAG TPA: ribonuclease HII [Chloroflexota bacterium]|nr:ribonuclease HII [Chloroflexota bacterium]